MNRRLPGLRPSQRSKSLPATCLLLLTLATSPSWAQSDARETIDSLDRAFGYTIGDLVRRQITIRGGAREFSRDRLPEPGAVTAWLALDHTALQQSGDDVILTLVYQVTGANSEVALLELPAVELKNADKTLARIDALPISVSPIIGSKPFVRTGMNDLQPERLPAAPDFEILRRRLTWFAGTSVALLTLLGWRRWRRTRNSRSAPFAQARRALRHESDAIRGYQLLHRAFDQTAGRSLFLEDLNQFLNEQPTLASARTPIETFFEQSRSVFFESATSASDPERLQQIRTLVGRLAKLEAKSL